MLMQTRTDYEVTPGTDSLNSPVIILIAAVAMLLVTLAVAQPARTAHDGDGLPKGVSETCQTTNCLLPRQVLAPRDAWRLKHDLGERVMLVDLRDWDEVPAGLDFGQDAHVPFMHAGALPASCATPGENLESRPEVASTTDDGLRSAERGYNDRKVLMAPSRDCGILAALLLQEHGYKRPLVMAN